MKRFLLVTLGLVAGGALLGAIAGGAFGALLFVLDGEVAMLRHGHPFSVLMQSIAFFAGFGVRTGGLLGAILLPVARWTLLRHVTIGVVAVGTTIGTVAGAIAGLYAQALANPLHSVIGGAVAGFVVSVVVLHVRWGRPLPARDTGVGALLDG